LVNKIAYKNKGAQPPLFFCITIQFMVCLIMIFISKEQFLEEHNKLSPLNLKATPALLNRFKEEKKPLIKDNEWCLDKFRIPFILWLTAAKKEPEKKISKSKKDDVYKNYPETHYD